MKIVSVETALKNIQRYLKNDIPMPFFVVVDDSAEYSDIITGLGTLNQMRVSDYCTNDAYPDIDALCADISAGVQNVLLLGLGESVSLGSGENAIGKIKDLILTAKHVIICRGVRAVVNNLCLNDKKFDSRRVCFLKSGASYEIVKFPLALDIAIIDSNGFKEMLFRLENGVSNTLFVKTSLALHNVRDVHSAYEAIRQVDPTFTLSQTCLPDNLWVEFLTDKNLEGFNFFHWRSFLKLKLESSANKYLKYVTDTANDYDIYKKRIFSALLDFAVNDKCFSEMYIARKNLLKGVKNSDIAEYITETIIKDNDRICYLTDNTTAEKQAIIEFLNGVEVIPNSLKDIYHALHEYLYDFSFTGDKGELLTEYFAEYKRLKLTNRLTPEFHKQVQDFAIDGNRPYIGLEKRGAIFDKLDKTNTILYWLDALGAEYLGYIQKRANSLGLKIATEVGCANLPTITSFNKDFYDAWSSKKIPNKDLDKVKHNLEQDVNYQPTESPIYIVKELNIIDDVLDWIKAELAGKKADKVILISDHGTSRLAVINEQECKWEMASQGEHSGRCCPCNEADVKSEYATEENGFWILANYDRFKGGRKASVEVHGGASLEEVVVPLIEITLFNNKIEVSNTTPVTTASFKKNAEIVLFSKNALKRVSVKVLEVGKQYDAESVGNNKHKVIFTDIKQAQTYTADVFEGDNLIGQVKFEVQRESGKTNDSDWF